MLFCQNKQEEKMFRKKFCEEGQEKGQNFLVYKFKNILKINFLFFGFPAYARRAKNKTPEKLSEKMFRNFVERKQIVVYKRCSTEQEKK